MPGDRNIAYVGAASGGIFKTEDAGVTWHPVFDSADGAEWGTEVGDGDRGQILWNRSDGDKTADSVKAEP